MDLCTNPQGICQGDEAAASAADDDDEVVYVGCKRRANPLPHARHDCPEFELDPGDGDASARRHCSHCWCAVCGTPVEACTSWGAHCRTTAAQAEALAAAKRAAETKAKLQAAPAAGAPPDASSSAVALILDHRWLQLRFDALSYLLHCGQAEVQRCGMTTSRCRLPHRPSHVDMSMTTTPRPQRPRHGTRPCPLRTRTASPRRWSGCSRWAPGARPVGTCP